MLADYDADVTILNNRSMTAKDMLCRGVGAMTGVHRHGSPILLRLLTLLRVLGVRPTGRKSCLCAHLLNHMFVLAAYIEVVAELVSEK